MAEPIRVLQVFAKMNRGGAETMIMDLYHHIDRTKVQFDFIVHTAEKCDFDDEIEQLGGNIYSMPKYNGKNHFIYKKAWDDFFKEHSEYNIIHGHLRSTAAIYLKIAKRYGMITIAHSHSTSSGNGYKAFVKNLLQHQIKFTSDYMLACSYDAGKWLFGGKNIELNKCKNLKNAIEISKFIFNKDVRMKVRKDLNLDGKYVVGHVGRFYPPKNHEFVIDVFNLIKKEKDNAVLILIGDGPDRKIIEDKVQKFGLGNSVIFLGVRSDVNELIQAMDVFLFPSKYEGLGIVLIEAQASGLKCIVSDLIPEEAFVTDLVESISLKKSTDVWKTAILKYSDGYPRRNTYEEIKAKGYDIIDTANWLENFYLSIKNN
ncbi:MAG TPA: glycosyltransferase family 1 protein [Clostridiales bacterium]|nr:glycosyltransferase family 1 protein [Clostridiales bacterium]